MIKKVIISTSLIEEILRTGYLIKPAKVIKGISSNDYLINVKLNTNTETLELWFNEFEITPEMKVEKINTKKLQQQTIKAAEIIIEEQK